MYKRNNDIPDKQTNHDEPIILMFFGDYLQALPTESDKNLAPLLFRGRKIIQKQAKNNSSWNFCFINLVL